MQVLVVDDHPIVRFGLRQLIHTRWAKARVIEADTADAAVRALQAGTTPSVILLDATLPDAEGLEGLGRLQQAAGAVPILMLCPHADGNTMQRLLQMGAAGCIAKDVDPPEWLNAIDRVLGSGRYVPAQLTEWLMRLLSEGDLHKLPHERLTHNEFRVMQLIALGHRPAQIAAQMGLSSKTVSNYRTQLMAKTGWRNTSELIKYCIEQGLVPPI